MDRTLKLFTRLLSERLEAGSRTKEDEFRYTFFAAILDSGFCAHTEVALEVPHEALGEGREIDTVIAPRKKRPAYAIEFKFDQIPPNGQQNKTNRAGAVFNDLLRLATARFDGPTRKLFVYATDKSMNFYFQNSRHNLIDFYMRQAPVKRFPVGLSFWGTRPASFLSQCKIAYAPFDTEIVFESALPRNYVLKVFEVFESTVPKRVRRRKLMSG